MKAFSNMEPKTSKTVDGEPTKVGDFFFKKEGLLKLKGKH